MIWNFKLCNCFVTILAICCLISCEKDEIEPIQEESIFPKISGRVITPKDMKSDPLAYHRLMGYITKPIAKSSSGIELDTTYIKVIDTDKYSSYTFKIKQDSIERTKVLRNFMLTTVSDTIQIQHLVDYAVLSDGSIDMDNIQMKRLYGDELLSLALPKCSSGGGSTFESYQSCYTTSCIGTGSDNHEFGDSTCSLWGKEGGATLSCATRWREIPVDEPVCETIDAGDSGGGGGGGNPGGGSNDDDVIIVPVDPNNPDNPCGNNSISDGSGGCFDGSDDPTDPILKDPTQAYIDALLANDVFKSNVRELERAVSLKRETGFAFLTRDRDRFIAENVELTPVGYRSPDSLPNQISIPFTFRSKVIVHVHYKSRPITPTLDEVPIPMFSPQDIAEFNKNLISVYEDLQNQGLDPLAILQELNQYSIMVITAGGNYMIRWNGLGENLVDVTIPNPDSGNLEDEKLYQRIDAFHRESVGKDPESGIEPFLNFLSAGNQYEVHKFDLDGNLTPLN